MYKNYLLFFTKGLKAVEQIKPYISRATQEFIEIARFLFARKWGFFFVHRFSSMFEDIHTRKT